MCNRIREDLLGEVKFPFLAANLMYGVLSKRIHQRDGGTDLYVGDDEGDIVIKFYETLAEKYWLHYEGSLERRTSGLC